MSSNVSIDGFEMEMAHRENNSNKYKEKAMECFVSCNLQKMIVSFLFLLLVCTSIYQITRINHNEYESKTSIDKIHDLQNETTAVVIELVAGMIQLEERLNKFDIIMVQDGLEPYLPYGPQQHVPIKLVRTGGWKKCFSQTYDVQLNSDALHILGSSCTASKIMLACRMTNHSHITVLAWGSREKVLQKSTDPTPNPLNWKVENGTKWYYYEEIIFVSPYAPGIIKKRQRPLFGENPLTKGSIGFAVESDHYRLDDGRDSNDYGYISHDFFGRVDQEKSNSHKRMSWRILDYPSEYMSIKGSSRRYETGGTCGENKELDSGKWERLAFEM